MSSSVTPVDCDAVAEKAFALMRERSVPLSPANFAIWFEYFAGTNPELTAMGDRLLELETPISEATGAWLHNTFAPEQIRRKALMGLTNSATAAVGQVVAQLTKAGHDVESYGQTLGMYEAVLASHPTEADAARALSALVAATNKMHEDNARLEAELASSTHRIGELQGTLENLRRDAATDKLTGLANRRSFDEFLDDAMAKATSGGAPLSLLMLDVDHFKKFNDSYGHQIGDEVLKLVARTLTEQVKGRDIAARYGGEEFAIVLIDAGLEQARTVGEQIRVAMASRRIVRRNSGVDYGQVTLSIGIAVLHPDDQAKTLIERADGALYVAKRGGRNQVRTESHGAGKPALDPAIRTAAALA